MCIYTYIVRLQYTQPPPLVPPAKWRRRREEIYTRRGVTSRVTYEWIEVDHQLPRTDYDRLMVSDGHGERKKRTNK